MDDSGLIAAFVIGLAVANMPGFDIPVRRPFFETLVQLVIGLLFISISATVTPASLRHVALPALGLAAILVFAVRPVVAWLSTRGTDLITGERSFVGWMAPRGIVAAATASTFSAALAANGIGGASKMLPATFMVIVATVALYGLTAVPVAKRLGVTRPPRTQPLRVGGESWVVELGRTLRSAGLEGRCGPERSGSETGSGRPGWSWRPASCLPRPPAAAPSLRESRWCCPVTDCSQPGPRAGDTAVVLGPAG